MRKRWLWLICSFLAIYLVNFLIPRLMPGDPFRYTSSVSGDDLDAGYSAEQVEQLIGVGVFLILIFRRGRLKRRSQHYTKHNGT